MIKLRFYKRTFRKMNGINRFGNFELSVLWRDHVIVTLTLTICLPRKRGV